MPYAEDIRLLQAAARGQALAARRFIDRVGPVVYGFVFARVGGHEAAAEDIVQETFVEAIRSAGSFRGDAALTTWMCTIARRRIARYYETERRREDARDELTVIHLDEDVEPFELIEDRDALTRALGRLSAVHRQVLVLKYLDDCAVADVAEQLGRTPVQIQSLLQRARTALRNELEVEVVA